MLRTVLPFCLMLMSAPPSAQAFDSLFTGQVDPVFGVYTHPPQANCHYSFYIGRYTIQIRDTYGGKRNCRYVGSSGNVNYYECLDANQQPDGDQVEVGHNGWGGVRWVRFNSSEDMTAYCQ